MRAIHATKAENLGANIAPRSQPSWLATSISASCARGRRSAVRTELRGAGLGAAAGAELLGRDRRERSATLGAELPHRDRGAALRAAHLAAGRGGRARVAGAAGRGRVAA